MLRLRSIAHAAYFASLMCAAQPLLAQKVTPGLTDKIDAAEKKLDDDIKACRPINVDDYDNLFDAAQKNYAFMLKATVKNGLPPSPQVTSDRNRASALQDRAKQAAKNPCPPPQKAPPPNQAPAPPPKLLPQAPGQLGGGLVADPWTEINLEAWDLFDDLDEAIWFCDLDAVKKLIPELEDLLKRARQVAATAKAAGKFSKIDPAKAQKLVESIQDALDDAKSIKACPLPAKESTTTPKPSTGNSEKPSQPSAPGGKGKAEKSSLNDLFKAEKPTPPKYSIVEDLREPPTPFELHAIQDRVRELGKLTNDYPNLLEGCHPNIWDKHIGHLEDLAKRARQIADDVKRGYSNGVSAKDAEQTANEAEKAVGEARRGKAANQEQWKLPECPKTTPLPKSDKTQGMRFPAEPSPYQNVGAGQTGSYAGGLVPVPQSPPEAKTAKQEYDAIYYGLGGLGYAFASSGGCDQQQLQRYIAGLENLAGRARALAEVARQGGEFSTVNVAQVQQLAQHIQRHVEEVKQFDTVDCPAGTRFKMNPWNSKIVAIHNQERAAVGAPPLHWDPILAAHADSYAQQLARTGQLTHAPREGRGIERENLGQGRMGWSPEDIVRNEWMSEKRSFHAGIFPDVCIGGGSTCWHYSEAIWDGTTDIGCGYATGSGSSWLVCRYSPGGNKDKYPVGYYDPWSTRPKTLPTPPPPPP